MEIKNNASRTDEAVKQIVQHILDQGLSEGERLPNERELSEMLCTSRSTLREAMKKLEARNVITVKRGVGAFVSYKHGVADDPLGFTMIRNKEKLAADLLEFRILIEPRMAELAAQHATPDAIAELEYLCDMVDEQIKAGKLHIDADREYHTMIARCSGNLIMPKVLPIIHSAINLFITQTKSSLLEETMRTHRAVLNAIKRRDTIGAHDAMLLHLIYNRDRLHSNLSAEESQ